MLRGGPVLGREGGETSSPKRSIDGFDGLVAAAGCLWDEARSMFEPLDAGTGSSPSNVAGSGIGPSITQRFDSYFVLIKFSILASDGIWPGASFDSQYLSQ